MSQFFSIHPETPQPRLVKRAVEMIRAGAVIAYPTDSAYALGCHLGDKQAADRIRAIRQIDDRHHLTLVCSDLSELSLYARVDNTDFRLLKNNTPGPYTFLLNATREVPRRLMHPKKREIGLRIPEHPITQALLAELGEPLLSTSLIMPGEDEPMVEPWAIRETLEHSVDLVIDGGYCGFVPTTVISLLAEIPTVVREGAGDPAPFEQ
ncbi:threonylcarbamoyl-AMP synthase [Natronospirillum operosum]|uniref:Threonylcarbamoyl-AMP synthase n=1 Tax=Natronospirillum operosum TaxID=2759953 RepID=A0A4Z0WKQ4_9GAMM|nr:L-threonylcarbamoyladenylate synthase [Natronospirillum operosum]TGG95815.1 threonylcarbamoyl-AMP synthase [Natronospirillum operosum]